MDNRIAAVIAARTNEEVYTQIRHVSEYLKPTDLIEWRADALEEKADVEQIINASAYEILFTLRHMSQSGGVFGFNGEEDERMQLFARASKAGAAYVDIEYDASKKKLMLPANSLDVSTIVVGSYHNFTLPPDTPGFEFLSKVVDNILSSKAVAKIAMICAKEEHADVLKELHHKYENRIIVSGMGKFAYRSGLWEYVGTQYVSTANGQKMLEEVRLKKS